MNSILKNAREQKKLKTRELALLVGIDQALISKFENGTRNPTKQQIKKLAEILEIDYETLIIEWIKSKILNEIKDEEEFGLKALKVAHAEANFNDSFKRKPISKNLQSLVTEIDVLKKELDNFRPFDDFIIAQELDYTFESNKIEGNTLTLREIDLVVNKGLTVSGKSMREHLEVINHQDAIHYIKQIVERNFSFNERELLSIHKLILRGIIPDDTGRYRKVPVTIKESLHLPPQPYLVEKAMEDYFKWYLDNKNKLHPIILAAEMHQRLVSIHPFIDGNGQTSRLVMNLILLQNGYVITNIKGDFDIKMNYYKTLEIAQTSNNNEEFLLFIAQTVKESLEIFINSKRS